MNKFAIALLSLAALVLGYMSVFTVYETEQALVLQLGEHKRTITEPGLNFKLPFVQNVVYLDKRILNLDVPPQEILSSDPKNLVVDAIARFKIVDPLLTYQTRRNEAGVSQALATMVSSNVREIVARTEFLAFLTGERAALMQQIRDEVNEEAKAFGVEIVDVRLRRVDLPVSISEQIFEQMNTERQQQAEKIRADGRREADIIEAEAEREVTVTIANAERDSQILRGEGDSEAVRIFAESFGRDEEFFEFYRSMQAYRGALKPGDTTLVLSPKSEFFKYLDSMTAGRDKR